jgi:hypothetical protein
MGLVCSTHLCQTSKPIHLEISAQLQEPSAEPSMEAWKNWWVNFSMDWFVGENRQETMV